MHLAARAALLVALASCKPGPPPVQNTTPLMHATGMSFDGFSLGDPVGSFVAKFGEPCDIDPIDKERSTLFFWSGVEGCREQKAFPEGTTVIVLTPYNKAEREQPMDLLAWFGGSYFNTRATVEAHIGDMAPEVDKKLGEPTHKQPVEDSKLPGTRIATYKNDVHVIFQEERAVGIAVGKLRGGTERENILSNGYAHHLRYATKTEDTTEGN